MFITKTDYIIIMENIEKPISIPDLLKLEEAGIETIFFANHIYLELPWDIFLDRIDLIVKNTNLKILVSAFFSPLYDWWLIPIEQSDPVYRQLRQIDYANPEVGPSIDRYMMDILARVDKTRVQVICTGVWGGEFLWENNNLSCPVPMEMLTKFMVDRQRIGANQYGEVWTVFHHNLGGNLDTTTAINAALYNAFPTDEYEHYRMQAMQFTPGTTVGGEEFAKRAVLSNPRSKYFVGSEWPEGLAVNCEKLKDHGAYGFLTSPMHTAISYTQIEDWMLDNIREAIRKLSLERQ